MKQTQHPGVLVITSGDFNHLSLMSHSSGGTQYVDYFTRGDKTLVLAKSKVLHCYYLTSLDRSDHALVFLQPSYKLCTRQPVKPSHLRKWCPEASEALKNHFAWIGMCC